MADSRNAHAYAEMLDDAMARVSELENALEDAVAQLGSLAGRSTIAMKEVDELKAVLNRDWR